MFKRGDIVWGKLKSFPWWPAVVLNPEDCGRDTVGKNKYWLFWFGDHMVAQVEIGQVLDFREGYDTFCLSKVKKPLKSAIEEVLNILAARCSIKVQHSVALFEWAGKAFKSTFPLPCDNSNSFELPDLVISALQKFLPKLESTQEENSRTSDETVALIALVLKGSLTLEDICVMCCRFGTQLVIQHPYFIGGVCEDCRKFVTKIMECPNGQLNDICILCGQGGNLLYCCKELCMSAYCDTCIEYMTQEETLLKILENDFWECYLCKQDPHDECLIKRREIFLPANIPARPTVKSPMRILGLTDAASYVLKEKNIAVESSETNQSLDAEQIEDGGPNFIYRSFFVSPAFAFETEGESRKLFFRKFYDFLNKLLVARAKNPNVFFTYLCDDKVLDPLIMKRLERFLQVTPLRASTGKKNIYAWTNVPFVKMDELTFPPKKDQTNVLIEAMILDAIFEPLKIIFKPE